MFLSLVLPVRYCLCLLDFIDLFLFHVGEIFTYSLFKNFLIHFLFLFFFWGPQKLNIFAFYIVPEVSESILSFFFILFILFCSSEVISTILSSSSLILSAASDILLSIPSTVYLISLMVLLVSISLLFNFSKILLIPAFSPLCFQDFHHLYYDCCRKEDLPGPKTGLLFNTQK